MKTVKIKSGDVKIIAHRGLSGLERENTVPAFVAAGKRSYFGIETDIHKTADGKFVVIHDETTKRVSLGEFDINVEASNYSELENIILPDLDGSKTRTDIRIPLLADYIKVCKEYKKVCVLELKNPFSQDDIIAVIDEIQNLGYLDKVVFISFVRENCKMFRSLLKDNEIQWLTSDRVSRKMIKGLLHDKLDLDIRYSKLRKRHVKKLHKNGIKVNCWTCDDAKKAEKLIEMGVDFITTNILE